MTIASAAQAQTAYDISLRSIGQPTITSAGLDGRSRQAVLSIGAASLENAPSVVPAVYDPTVGRFVSAIGGSRGAISVTSTGAVSVIINSQSNNMVVGSATGVPLRSENVIGSSATLTSQQVTVTPAGSGR